MQEVEGYENAYYSMIWLGPKGYPENANAGRCYFTGLLGMYRLNGETDILFADGTSGDGFSFRWWPHWGAPAFNGGKGAFHEIWEYTSRSLGFDGRWEEDPEGGWDEAWEKLRGLIDRMARLLPRLAADGIGVGDAVGGQARLAELRRHHLRLALLLARGPNHLDE